MAENPENENSLDPKTEAGELIASFREASSEAVREVAFDRGIGFQPVVFFIVSQAGSLRHVPLRIAS